ncbi:MAG: glycerol-3-phosphate acyltransferase [Chloroflexi bacterium]|nr:glycerol-3-phosphate acyltransferase [Chloroflexota bacterium]
MVVIEALALVLAYLWGAFPTAYLAGRLKGIDIRKYGSGNVGASNIMVLYGPWAGLALGIFDGVVKGTLPVLLVRGLDLSLPVQAGVGLAAVAGHNWSPYIGFTGGRGLATALGVLLGFYAWPEMAFLLLFAGGIGFLLLRKMALFIAAGFALLPPLAYLAHLWGDPFHQSLQLVYLTAGVLLLALTKRLTANWERPPSGEPLRRVLLYRLLYDRDVASHEEWVRRGTTGDQAW